MKNQWIYFALLVACLFYGFLWAVSWTLAVVIGGAAFLLLSVSLPIIARFRFSENKWPWAGSFGFALFFCLCIPLQVLFEQNSLYHFAVTATLPIPLLRLVNLFENLLIAGLTLGLAFSAIFCLWTWLAQPGMHPTREQVNGPRRAGLVLLYGLPGLIVWSLFVYGFWPGNAFNDTYTQWLQIINLGTLDDWHPVTHTLFEYLITRVWYHPGIIAIFQAAAMALAWGWAMSYFETQGLHRPKLLLVSLGFALFPTNGILLIALLKDVPFSILNFVLVFLLGIVWVSNGHWLRSKSNQIVLGLVLAFTSLFRHNGLVILLLVPLAMLLYYRQERKATLWVTVTAILLVVGIRDGLAFGILKAGRNPTAILYVIPIHHINAVIYHGGEYSPSQAEVLQKIAPIEIWKDNYNPFYADNISKDYGLLRDPMIYQKIEQNQAGLLRTFFELATRYPSIMLRSELELMNPIWSIAYKEQDPPWLNTYVLETGNPFPGVPAELFAQPNTDSAIKFTLDNYLSLSNQTVTRQIFWRGGLYFFMTLLLCAIFISSRGWDALVLFIPSLANIFSLFIAMPVQDYRYIYPFIACIPLLFMFGMVRRERRLEN